MQFRKHHQSEQDTRAQLPECTAGEECLNVLVCHNQFVVTAIKHAIEVPEEYKDDVSKIPFDHPLYEWHDIV